MMISLLGIDPLDYFTQRGKNGMPTHKLKKMSLSFARCRSWRARGRRLVLQPEGTSHNTLTHIHIHHIYMPDWEDPEEREGY
jgi:hypothetical protein